MMVICKIIWAVILALLIALALIGALAVFCGILYYSDKTDREQLNNNKSE